MCVNVPSLLLIERSYNEALRKVNFIGACILRAILLKDNLLSQMADISIVMVFILNRNFEMSAFQMFSLEKRLKSERTITSLLKQLMPVPSRLCSQRYVWDGDIANLCLVNLLFGN